MLHVCVGGKPVAFIGMVDYLSEKDRPSGMG
jgi:hypothetical protein